MAYDVGSMPFPVAFRLLTLANDGCALLNASPELRETIATGLTLEFIQRLRADLVVTPCGERAWFVSQSPQQDRDATLAALQYMSKENVLPLQLAQQGGATLRQLIVEATRGVPAVWIWAFAGELDWFAKVLMSVASIDESVDCATKCCNRITVRSAEGRAPTASTVFRFLAHESLALACSVGHPDCLLMLRERSPDVDATAVDVAWGRTPAAAATVVGHGECLSVLRDWGVDLAACDPDGDHCGHLAVRFGHEHILRLLHEWGVNLAAPGADGMPPAHQAIYHGELGCLAVLREVGCADESLEDLRGRRLGHCAAQIGQVDALRLLHKWGFDLAAKSSSDGRTPAFYAALTGRDDCLQLLREWGCLDALQRTRRRETLAHAAAEGGHLSTLKLLRTLGVDVNQADTYRETPFSIARIHGHTACQSWLDSLNEASPLVRPWQQGYTMSYH